ncbi:helix-turn-helix domain-containing protein [Paenibacillus phocaensis]|uniref:helix-turn-helix domain-containing protein n=1 Tax=Paenibacillus phocaensis TaxID=1776378 RepID=UPI0003A5F48F|nr:helix-turn-helix transcriptional regulator [Paenibacillus phocaensis]
MNHLKYRTTIIEAVHNYMEQNGLSLTQLAKQWKLNPGTVSSILNGNRPLAVEQLERITAVMELPRGYFYRTYIGEYLHEANPDWRRVKPMLQNCAEMDMPDLIREIVGLLLDNPLYAHLLFDLAEEFYEAGQLEAAGILYENVALTERRQHSERLALCQYRLFLIGQGHDQDQNFQAAIQFEPFVERLDEASQLDALKDLANAYRALNRWDKVEKIVLRMEQKAKIYYFSERKRTQLLKKTNRPLFFYLAYSYLFLGNIYDIQGEYEEALRYIGLYADLSWVKENDPETLHWKELFQEWAQANALLTRLSSGDVSVFPDYVASIVSKKDDAVLALLNIMEAANRFDIDVDDIIQCFEVEIVSLTKQPTARGLYTEQTITNCISQLLNELAIYYLRKGKYSEGFNYFIESLEQYCYLNIHNRSLIIKYVELFERYKNYASPQVIDAYQQLIGNLK